MANGQTAALAAAPEAKSNSTPSGHWLGGLLAKPWVDPVCLWGMKRLLPASRAWAAAAHSEGSPERFAEILRLECAPTLLSGRLKRSAKLAKLSAHAQAQWERIAFDKDNGDLHRAERVRRRAAEHFLGQRFQYWFFASRNSVPPVACDVPLPDSALSELGAALNNPNSLFRLPETLPNVEKSASIDHGDTIEYWLRFPGETLGERDMAYVHVYEPKQAPSGKGVPSLIFGHGLAMELEMMTTEWRDFRNLARYGVRVLLPDAPGHNRRCRPGFYGGENFMVHAPISSVQLFKQVAQENAVMVQWCRAQGSQIVGLGGISLGALSSQVTAGRWNSWPASARADVLFLVTTTDRVSELALDSSLAKAAAVDGAVCKAGWKPEHFLKLAPLTDASNEPPLDPGRIVLVLGQRDDVTPYAGGERLAKLWRIPPENLYIRDQGHFSAAFGLGADPAPFDRVLRMLAA